jgi:hypothetical protein
MHDRGFAATREQSIAAVHSQCRNWVISGQTIAGPAPANGRYGPKADKSLRIGFVR